VNMEMDACSTSGKYHSNRPKDMGLGVWTGLLWSRIGANGRLSLGLKKKQEISWIAINL
jgi:hypothetical protein